MTCRHPRLRHRKRQSQKIQTKKQFNVSTKVYMLVQRVVTCISLWKSSNRFKWFHTWSCNSWIEKTELVGSITNRPIYKDVKSNLSKYFFFCSYFKNFSTIVYNIHKLPLQRIPIYIITFIHIYNRWFYIYFIQRDLKCVSILILFTL